jgi:hypothetical protein
MSKKSKIIVLITIISIVELVLIKPFAPGFFGMNFMWKTIYSLSLFGFPVLIIIPSAFLAAPFALLFKREKSFISVWFRYAQNSFLVMGILLLIMNTFLVVLKYGIGQDPFPLKKYDEIKGFEGSTEDLRIGKFENKYGVIERSDHTQVEKYKNGDTSVFTIEWISSNEYRLINQGENYGMNDTLDIKIISNTTGHYDCYVRFGKYADFDQIIKK